MGAPPMVTSLMSGRAMLLSTTDPKVILDAVSSLAEARERRKRFRDAFLRTPGVRASPPEWQMSHPDICEGGGDEGRRGPAARLR